MTIDARTLRTAGLTLVAVALVGATSFTANESRRSNCIAEVRASIELTQLRLNSAESQADRQAARNAANVLLARLADKANEC